MKAIHYDAEGDILSVTFSEHTGQKQTGVELSDNLALYYNPETGQPIKLIAISYQALLQAKTPIVLDGLADAPVKVRATILEMLERAPLSSILELP